MMRFFLLALIVLFIGTCGAATSQHDYVNSSAGKALLHKLGQQGVDVDRARRLLADAIYQPDIVKAMRSPAESTMTWKKYRGIFLGRKRIQAGAQFIRQHRDIFNAVEEKYGVPASVIAAIIGVETSYGRHLGRHRVLDALATLAFDYPARSEFFTSELEHFLQLCVEENLDCRHETGSYAGAMGLPQFMPSSYRHYAVDFNHDGRRDLWNEPGDIIASVANYLARNGWQAGGRIALPAHVADNADLTRIRRSRTKTRYDWQTLHQAGIDVTHPPAADTRTGLLEYQGHNGTEYWVGLHNFFVITTYNHSPLYAMAVKQLARQIGLTLAETQS